MVRPINLAIVGAQKSGTTSLFNYLSQHPDVHTHPQREMTYFVNDTSHQRSYEHVFVQYFGDGGSGKPILLAKHVMIMYSQKAIKRLYQHNQDMEIVVTLRNPIDRAYSAYWYARRRGWEKIQSFEDALEAEESRLQEGWAKWNNCLYLYNGIYHHHIKALFEKFPEDQVRILLLEHLKEDPLKICREIFSSLRINAVFTPDVRDRLNRAAAARSEAVARIIANFLSGDNLIRKALRTITSPIFSTKLRHFIFSLNEKEITLPPMNLETRKYLIKYFRPHNERLGELLKLDVSHWNI